MHTHHIMVAVQAPERLGRNHVNSWLSHTLERGMTGNTAQSLAVACNVDARELVDNSDLYNITTQVITTNRPPLPAPVVKLLCAARAAVRGTDDELNIDTVTFTIDGRIFLFDQWNFRQPDFSAADGALSDAMEEATRFIADSYPLPVTFEWPGALLDDDQRISLAHLKQALRHALDDGSLKAVVEKTGGKFDPDLIQEQLVTIENILKEKP